MYMREVIQSKLQPRNPASYPSSMLAAFQSVSLGHVYPTAVEALDQDSGSLLSADRPGIILSLWGDWLSSFHG